MTDLLGGYRFDAAWDEAFSNDGAPRPTSKVLHESLTEAGPATLSSLANYLHTAFRDQGITFDHQGVERPFPLDIVPRIITADEWNTLTKSGEDQAREVTHAFTHRKIAHAGESGHTGKADRRAGRPRRRRHRAASVGVGIRRIRRPHHRGDPAGAARAEPAHRYVSPVPRICFTRAG